MLKSLYQRIVIGILKFFNYNRIEDTTGTTHPILNILDIFLAVAYAGISYWKLSSVTFLVLIINLITLLRLIFRGIKKSLDVRDKYEMVHLTRPDLRFKTVHDIKLIFELCVLVFFFGPFCILGAVFEAYVIQGFAMVIITFSLVDNFLSIFAELFKASMDITKMKVID